MTDSKPLGYQSAFRQWGIVMLSMLSVITPSLASQQYNFSQIEATPELIWYPCYINFSCARLEAPLVYTKPWGPKVTFPLIKLAATDKVGYRGMVLTNPGGPGGSGINQIASSGTHFQSVVGSDYDIISWDPRGVGLSTPLANCSVPTTTASKRSLNSRYIDIKGPELNHSVYDDLYSAGKELGDVCEAEMGAADQIGPNLSTADNVRDMIYIADAFAKTKDGRKVKNAHLVNYWGFSYGSYLGETFASMYPNRVGRFVLDGVIDPEDFTSGLTVNNVNFMDDVFALFFVYCNLAGPELCPYYTGTTAVDIYKRFEISFWKLNPKQAIAEGWENATWIESELRTIKARIESYTYSPISSFPYLSALGIELEQTLQNRTESALSASGTKRSTQPSSSALVAIESVSEPAIGIAIWCSDGDGTSYNLTMAELEPWLVTLRNESVIGGELWTNVRIGCATWPIIGQNRYTGKFGAKTATPILFVSNTFDPVTPIINSRKEIKHFANAQLLTVDGTGHTSSSSNNTCAYTKIGIYFQTGQLPGKDNFCKNEAGPFGLILPGTLEQIQGTNDFKTIKERMRKLKY